jgi:hypothetical protein
MYGNLDQFLDNLLGAPASRCSPSLRCAARYSLGPCGSGPSGHRSTSLAQKKKIRRGDCGHCTALLGHRIFAAQTYTITNLKNIPL